MWTVFAKKFSNEILSHILGIGLRFLQLSVASRRSWHICTLKMGLIWLQSLIILCQDNAKDTIPLDINITIPIEMFRKTRAFSQILDLIVKTTKDITVTVHMKVPL